MGFESIETQPVEPSLFERTPIEKLLDAEVIVEIPNFPYPTSDTPIKYELGETKIEIKTNIKEGRHMSVSVALQTSSDEKHQLYLLQYAHYNTTNRLEYLSHIFERYESLVASLSTAHKEDQEKYPYGVSPTVDRIREGNNKAHEKQMDRIFEQQSKRIDQVDQIYPWERSDVINLGISKPTADNKSIVYFHTEQMPAEDYLRLPVKALPLEMLSDKEILGLILENIDISPESKEMWNLFLKTNQKNLPINAYLQISTVLQAGKARTQ